MILIFLVIVYVLFCDNNIADAFGGVNEEDAINSVSLYFYSPLHNREQIFDGNVNLKNFANNARTIVLIHGYIANRFHGSIEPLKNSFLSRGDVNLLISDWQTGAYQTYDQSRALVRKVGTRIGEILTDIIKNENITLDRIHLIGHSLGAHIAGNVGRYFNGKLGRVTGLDPAGPLFFKWSPDSIKSTDAQFVDIIHTCGNVLGEIWRSGHVDFYPNSGLPSQPGCLQEDVKTVFSCSHFRSAQYYAESVLIPNSFLSVECDLTEILVERQFKCSSSSSKAVYMGDSLPSNTRGVFYLETNDALPFGKGNFSETKRIWN